MLLSSSLLHQSRLAPCLVAFLLSCTSPTKSILFTTSPSGAEIIVNGKKLPKLSPVSADVKQQTDLSVTAIKTGYELSSTTVPVTVSRWRALIWTRYDPDTRYLDVDEVAIKLKEIRRIENVAPPTESVDLPPFDPSVKLPLIPVGGEGVELIKKE